MKRLLGLFLTGFILTSCHPAQAYQVFQGPPASKFSETFVQIAPNGALLEDSPVTDAAGRFRTSQPVGVFEDKRTYDTGAEGVWNETISGAGAAVAFLPNESSVTLTLGTVSGSKITRESRYLAYVPGKSVLVKMTGVIGTGVTNVTKRIGYFNDANGLFFQQTDSTLNVVMRTSTSGTPVNSIVPQSSWNLDKLDGTGKSKITLDVIKTQLMVIDFLWQGVGRVRYGFDIGGKIVYVHEVLNSNVKNVVFMGSPSLPARYEIENTGTSVGAVLKQICVSIDSEGGYTPPGLEFATSNGIAPRAVTTRVPVLAIRLTNAYKTLSNRRTVRILHTGGRATTNDAFCTVEHVQGVTADAGGTWTAVSVDSGVEFNLGLTSITASMSHVIDTNFAVSGQGSFSGTFNQSLSFLSDHSIIFQNTGSTQSQYFAIYCTSFTGTSNLSVELNWQEFD